MTGGIESRRTLIKPSEAFWRTEPAGESKGLKGEHFANPARPAEIPVDTEIRGQFPLVTDPEPGLREKIRSLIKIIKG